MNILRQIHWRRIVVAAVLSEAAVIAIFFILLFGAMLAGVPEVARPGSTLDYADAMVSSFAMVFFFALWVGKGIESGRVLHGVLVGAVAILLFVVLNFVLNGSLAEPPQYLVAHLLKVLGGIAGGLVAERRMSRPLLEVTPQAE